VFQTQDTQFSDDPHLVNDIAWLNVNEIDELTQCADACIDRWKAAGPDSRKKMFNLFAIAGIFLCVCRHGHLLFICDMIRSGELYDIHYVPMSITYLLYRMKYGIAITNSMLDCHGADIALGYDIMCAFIKTLHHSSIAQKVKQSRLISVVPAFHGHTHNRKCQVRWHPMYTKGAGTEDFEECERTFCGSNNLTNVTRLATPFHRRQEIQEYFHFHDHDKYISIGTSPVSAADIN
jgi:hypothetical protein